MEKIYIRDKVCIPVRSVVDDGVLQRYEKSFYDEAACRKCEYREDRHCHICDTCKAFRGKIKLWSKREIAGRIYYAFPIGDLPKLERYTGAEFSEHTIVDKRVKVPFYYPIKFTLDLYDYQKVLCKEFLKHKAGLIEAPPRTGKCVVGGTYIHTDRGMVTISSLFDSDHASGEYRTLSAHILSRNGQDEISHLYKERVKATFRCKTSFGYHVRGTPEHPMLVLTPTQKFVWKKLKDLQEGDVLCIQRKHSLFSKESVRIAAPLVDAKAVIYSLPKTVTPALARIMGYLVADGALSLNPIIMSTDNRRVQEDFKNCMYECFGYRGEFVEGRTVGQFTISSTFIRSTLESLGLKLTKAAGKDIPWSVLQSPREVVTAFLEAYFSCDSEMPKRFSDSIRLCSASRTLIDQLQILMLQYGIVSRRSSGVNWARNSKTPTKRLYHHLDIYSVERGLFLSAFNLLKDYTDYSCSKECSDFDVIPALGQELGNLHRDTYLRVGVYKSHSGEALTSRRAGKLIPGHTKGPTELCTDLNYRVADKISLPLLSAISPKLAERVKEILGSDFFFDRVVSNKLIDKPVWVYDVTVPKSHSFIANGLVSHNTACMLYINIKLGQKCLLLADQVEFLDQYLDHIYGNKKEGIPCCTNIPELEKKYGKKLAGIPKTDEDFENFQFFVMTYQQFLSETKGKDRLRRISKYIGTLCVDEVHSASADCFSLVVGKFKTYYRYGVTGTVERKDGKHYVIKKVFGPVVARTTVDALKPVVYVRESGAKYRSQPKNPTYAFLAISKNKTRNTGIVKDVIADLKAGHSIIIPLTFKRHIFELVRQINEAWGSEIARHYVGGGTQRNKEERRQTLSDAKRGKIRVVVGIRRLMQRGLNVKLWSAYYCVAPISNRPNLKQESNRICTPEDGKIQPIIRVVYDRGMGISFGCARNTIEHLKSFGFTIAEDDVTQEALAEFNQKRRRGGEDAYEDDFRPARLEFSEQADDDNDPLMRVGRGIKRK